MQKRKLTVEISFPDLAIDYYSDEKIRNFMTANIEYAVEQAMATHYPKLKAFACGKVTFGEADES